MEDPPHTLRSLRERWESRLYLEIAPHIDFFSIGTNDLTQYTLAAERGNPALSALTDALHPAVLRLIRGVVDAAHQHGKWVGVCGELAGDPLAVPVLVGLGVDELSMNPAGIPRAKAVLRAINLTEATELSAQVLSAKSSQDSRKLAQDFFKTICLDNNNTRGGISFPLIKYLWVRKAQ